MWRKIPANTLFYEAHFARTLISLAPTVHDSEAESFLPVPERRVKAPLIEAQSAAIARAMASICNDEQGCFGVQGGHWQKTLSLSGQATTETP